MRRDPLRQRGLPPHAEQADADAADDVRTSRASGTRARTRRSTRPRQRPQHRRAHRAARPQRTPSSAPVIVPTPSAPHQAVDAGVAVVLLGDRGPSVEERRRGRRAARSRTRRSCPHPGPRPHGGPALAQLGEHRRADGHARRGRAGRTRARNAAETRKVSASSANAARAEPEHERGAERRPDELGPVSRAPSPPSPPGCRPRRPSAAAARCSAGRKNASAAPNSARSRPCARSRPRRADQRREQPRAGAKRARSVAIISAARQPVGHHAADSRKTTSGPA